MANKSYQINNLKIVYSKFYNKWQVRTLKGVTLEEFKLLTDAKKWASKTHDFVQK